MIYLSQNADNFLVGWILGPIDLGLYVIAYRVLVVFTEVLSLTINQVALPLFSRYQDNPPRLHGAFYRAAELSVAVGWPAFAGLALVANQLIPAVFGQKWASSGPVMSGLAVAGFVQVATTFTQNLVIAIGRVDKEFRWNLFSTIIQVAGFGIAAPLGITAVAVALGVTTAVLWPIRIWQVSRWTGFDPLTYVRRLAGPAAATATMSLAVLAIKLLLRHLPLEEALPAEIVFGIVVYVAALVLLARGTFTGLIESLRLLRGSG